MTQPDFNVEYARLVEKVLTLDALRDVDAMAKAEEELCSLIMTLDLRTAQFALQETWQFLREEATTPYAEDSAVPLASVEFFTMSTYFASRAFSNKLPYRPIIRKLIGNAAYDLMFRIKRLDLRLRLVDFRGDPRICPERTLKGPKARIAQSHRPELERAWIVAEPWPEDETDEGGAR